MLKNYRELKVWQKSYRLCLDLYRITKEFPKEERYGLTSQMRRAAVSIPSNIAEGYGRRTASDYLRSLYIDYGSICEFETQLLLSGDLNYLKKKILRLSRMIHRKLICLRRKSAYKVVRKQTLVAVKRRSRHRGTLDPLNPRILFSN